jgi:acetylornithine deacetylase/succinyl-diaminopimelate desuccinylase-like protein
MLQSAQFHHSGVIMTDLSMAVGFAQNNHSRYLDELSQFVSIASISTLSEHKPDMQRAAEWVAEQMRAVGLDAVAIMPTAGHPVVYGEWLRAQGQPTVLIYGHYDVQPADPLSEWQSPPFEPTRRGDNLYARGVSDMKGQVHALLKALEATMQSGALPVNVKMLIEGEEEIGSPNLSAFIADHSDMLQCDFALNADSNILGPDQPSMVYGLRGLGYFEIWVQGPEHDLHSGLFGGAVHNPAQVLCELVAGMHDVDGRVTLPGFYDKVRVLDDHERSDLARTAKSDEHWRELAAVPKLHGEKGYTTSERLGARPTLEVNGLLSGFTGEGSKTVLPARAMAKISTRLIPYQDPHEVEQQLRAYLVQNAPPTVRWTVESLAGGPAVLVERDSAAARAAQTALEATFGKPPIFHLGGGSVPVVGQLKQLLNIDSVLMGFGLPDDNLHGPNEKQHLPTYFKGIEAYIRFFYAIAQTQ